MNCDFTSIVSVAGKGLNDDSVKKKKGVIRVVEYEQTLAFQETDSGGTKGMK